MDPFSSLGHSRARALNIDAIEEVNKSLNHIYNALNKLKSGRKWEEKKIIDKNDKEYLFNLIKQINDLKMDFPLEIRFYNLLTESPYYIISEFVIKGTITHLVSTVWNPWLIIVNEDRQEEDIFDILSDNFDRIWKVSREYPEGLEPIMMYHNFCFICMPFNNQFDPVLKIIKDVCNEYNLVPDRVDYRKMIDMNDAILDNIIGGIRRATIIISDLTENNANVFFETGIVQEMGKRRILIAQDVKDVAFDLRGQRIIEYSFKNLTKFRTGLAHTFYDKLFESRFGHIYAISKKKGIYFSHVPNAHNKVITCREAAKARKIELSDELKTIIFDVENRFYCIHVPGDSEISIPKIQDYFEIEHVALACEKQ